MIRDETVRGYLERLGSGEPTPGGGATGSVQLALASGLISMAARFSDREDLAQRCAELADTALELADQDEAGFGATAETFELPEDTEDERRERSERIQSALRDAVKPPQRMVECARELAGVAEAVLADANANVLSDVGAALGAVRAGLTAAVVTLETNLGHLKGDEIRSAVEQDVRAAEEQIDRVDGLIDQVRQLIRG
ncbi:cyclodeaminase/cyclohydrolase family protein [Micrococcus sp. IITD107]|uniref:cyclodeaminase/cyclohydrolase family protein n=1 Tax=Micrococcus sp. IITD107 TaxID=3342790 RepID=UPI0035BA32AB